VSGEYSVQPPYQNGGAWWKVVYWHEDLMSAITVAMFSEDHMIQAEMWAKLLAVQLNRGVK
jgi:hypothetical protein